MNSLKLLKKFVKYIKPYWFRESVLFVLMILTSAGSLASPYFLKIIIDEVFPSSDFDYLLKILLMLVGINIVRIAISFWSDYLYEWVSNHIVLDLRKDLFCHLIRLPISFFDKNKTGDIIHRISSEVNSVQSMLTGSFIRFINNCFTILGLTIALCLLNSKLFAISMIVVPFVFFNTKYFQPKIHAVIKKAREKDSDILNYFVERFENIKLIKSNNGYEFESNKLTSKIHTLIGFNLKNVKLSSGTRNISTFFVTLAPVLIFVFGGKEVMFGAMTLGSLVAFIQYLNRLFNPIRDIMGLYWDLIRSSVSMQRIFEFMSIETETVSREHINVNGEFKIENNIRFENVYFKYDGQWILNNLTLEFKKGKKYAIVGSSGCGKSTVVSLLNRFYEPQKGNILVDDIEIQRIDLHEFRRKIALVIQDNQLFHESIIENIKYGDFNSTDNEIEEMAKLTGLYEQARNMKEGFNSKIGDKGTIISGGQKQRIAIARAILKKAEIIILDEATSALDSESERRIIFNLCSLFNDKTFLLISHRLSAIKDVDEIICIDKGEIVEQGTYFDLIEKKEFFWKLFKDQIEEK